MLHICKDTYLQAVKKCYILYKSTTLRKLWNKKTILHKSQKNIEKEKKPYSLTGDMAYILYLFSQHPKTKKSNQEQYKNRQ